MSYISSFMHFFAFNEQASIVLLDCRPFLVNPCTFVCSRVTHVHVAVQGQELVRFHNDHLEAG